MILRNEDDYLRSGLSNEFVLRIVKESRETDLGEEKEDFENFVSDEGLD